MIDRRTFLAGTGAVFIAAPLAARAQLAALPRLGVLVASSPETAAPSLRAFREGLRDLGYVEGQNVEIAYQYDYGTGEALPKVTEFITANVAVIVAAGGPLALAASSATRKIPIVFVAAGDPVTFGIVKSLAHPGGNATGLSLIVDADFVAKWMELLKEAAPRLRHIAYINDANMRLPAEDARRAADRLKLVMSTCATCMTSSGRSPG